MRFGSEEVCNYGIRCQFGHSACQLELGEKAALLRLQTLCPKAKDAV